MEFKIGDLVEVTETGQRGRVKNVSTRINIKYTKKQDKWTDSFHWAELTKLASAGENICTGCDKVFKYKYANQTHCTKICKGYKRVCTVCEGEFNGQKLSKFCPDCYKTRNQKRSRERARDLIRGEIPTPDQVYYYNYKEPFTEFKDGYGVEGALAYSKDKEKIQCHFCGYMYRVINTAHIKRCEDIKSYSLKNKVEIDNTDDYKEVVGLNKQTALVGESVRENLITRGHKIFNRSSKEIFKYNKSKNTDKLIENNKKRKGTKMRLELRNQRGTCPEQLLDKIRVCAKELGKTPSKKDFYDFYKGRYLGIIYEVHGSWVKAVERAGMTPRSKIKGKKKYSREQLIDYYKDFYKRHNRVPTHSDHYRGLLPTFEVYKNEFGSINKARLAADLPILERVGRWKWIEVRPVTNLSVKEK